MGPGRLLTLGLEGDAQETYIHGNAFALLRIYVESVLPYCLDVSFYAWVGGNLHVEKK